MNFSTILLATTGWLPPWFVTLFLTFVGILLVLFAFKIVAFVLDCLPFM